MIQIDEAYLREQIPNVQNAEIARFLDLLRALRARWPDIENNARMNDIRHAFFSPILGIHVYVQQNIALPGHESDLWVALNLARLLERQVDENARLQRRIDDIEEIVRDCDEQCGKRYHEYCRAVDQ